MRLPRTPPSSYLLPITYYLKSRAVSPDSPTSHFSLFSLLVAHTANLLFYRNERLSYRCRNLCKSGQSKIVTTTDPV